MRRGRCARVRGVRRWGEGGGASSGDECKGAASGKLSTPQADATFGLVGGRRCESGVVPRVFSYTTFNRLRVQYKSTSVRHVMLAFRSRLKLKWCPLFALRVS